MATVYLLDAGLRERAGHHYQMAAGVRESVAALGHSCEVHAHASVSDEVRASLGARPTFSQYHYEFPFGDPWSMYLEDFLESAPRVADELEGAIGDALTDQDLLLFPTVGPRELGGLVLMLRRRKVNPKVVGIFHGVVLPRATLKKGTSGGAIYRYVGRLLAKYPGPRRLGLAATTRQLAQEVGKPLGVRVSVIPAPVWYPGAESMTAPAADGAPPVVLFLGQMRRNHGHALVPDVVRALQAGTQPCRCVIHLGAAEQGLDLSAYTALESEGLATLVSGWQSDDAIRELLRTATVVVFPYARDTFATRLSAAMCTAVGYGRPCVVPSDTWLSKNLDDGRAAGVAYDGEEPGAIAAAVTAVLGNRDYHVQRALALAPKWRDTQSGPVLVKEMVAWMEKPNG